MTKTDDGWFKATIDNPHGLRVSLMFARSENSFFLGLRLQRRRPGRQPERSGPQARRARAPAVSTKRDGGAPPMAPKPTDRRIAVEDGVAGFDSRRGRVPSGMAAHGRPIFHALFPDGRMVPGRFFLSPSRRPGRPCRCRCRRLRSFRGHLLQKAMLLSPLSKEHPSHADEPAHDSGHEEHDDKSYEILGHRIIR